MKFSYKFSNLLGTIYRCGNLLFTPDGNSIISPVGNRLSIFDLKNHKSRTLSLEANYNYTAIGLSPDGTLLLAVTEHGQAQLISLISCAIIHQHKFYSKVQCIRFSPDSAHFAVAMQNWVFVFKSPGELTGEYNPFVLERRYLGGYDDVTHLDWSTDSRFVLVGCKDNSTKIIALEKLNNFRTFILAGHTDSIMACFFEENSLDANTISRNGHLCLWECSLPLSEIGQSKDKKIEVKQRKKDNKRNKEVKTESGADDDDESDVEDDDVEETVANRESENKKLDDPLLEADDENDIKDLNKKNLHPFYYKKLGRHFLAHEPRKENLSAVLTAADYNRRTRVLVVGFSTGSFYLYDLPEVNLIHSLSISNYSISTAIFNCTGDWLALASQELGQLLVWEWQSEQYIMKQQGHSSEMRCLSYSPDGHYVATGGEDAKVKLWNTESGYCFVTFSEHSSGITAIQFSRGKKFLVSSSTDGTVRAFDILRYRNFRTFTTPNRVQFSCVSIDYADELVVAGGQDVFEIYMWSMKLGTLLEVISGHKAPVSSVTFAPVPTAASTLVSGSWDKSIKIWNCLESKSGHETLDVMSDVTCVTFHPNGEEVAVATLSCNIIMFAIKTSTQIGTIEGRNDLTSGRLETDVVTAERNQMSKFFTSIEYSADGECIIAAGKSFHVCIYHVKEAVLLKKFVITQNRSLDGMHEYISRRHLTEFGDMRLVEQREEFEGGNVPLRLPGVQKGDMAARRFKPEVQVFGVRFSPTGQSFATACTEGLCLFSLDKGVVFDPFDLSMQITPKSIQNAANKKDYAKALTMSLKLNENNLIHEILEKIPYDDIPLICSTLPDNLIQRLLTIVSQLLQTSHHVEFYLQWACSLLKECGSKDQNILSQSSLVSLHESLSRKYASLNRMCDYNKYTMRVLLRKAESKKKDISLDRFVIDINKNNVNFDSDDDISLLNSNNNMEIDDDQSNENSDHNNSGEEDYI